MMQNYKTLFGLFNKIYASKNFTLNRNLQDLRILGIDAPHSNRDAGF